MEINDLYTLYQKNYLVSTDTRNITPNAIFIALKGENFDANSFADTALEKGASYVVIDNKDYYKKDKRYIIVKDSLKTLQLLAQYHRKKLGIPIIALTGSNGKTTTKELINTVLATKYNTVATIGNLNNHIGVPLTLLAMTDKTEMGIVEMGANHFNEISLLCEIAQPNFGYITNFGKAHLEGFGSLEGVVRAKTELYAYLAKTDGIAFINHLDSKQITQTQSQKTHVLSTQKTEVESNPFVQVKFKDTLIKSQLIGSYNFSNIIAAIGIGQYFKIPDKKIKTALENYKPQNKRSQLIQKENTHIILDAYNANPTSMQAALDTFIKHNAKNKIVILGDMFELGNSAKKEHQDIADKATTHFEKVILIGENFYKTTSKAIKYKTYTAFQKNFKKETFDHKTLLIKGSRGMALERIVALIH